MQPQLGEADKRAVDVLLDRLPQSQHVANAGYTAAGPNIAEPDSLQAARTLLARLDAYEVDEPPADLLSRTLSRIAKTSQPGFPAVTDNDPASLPQALLSRPTLDS